MRNRILTPRERNGIRNYVKDGSDRGIVSQIRHRAKKAFPTIKEDMELVEQIL